MNTKSPALRKGESPLAAFLKDSLKTGALAILFTALLLCAAALVISRVDMPHTVFQPITTALFAAAVFFAALLTGRSRKCSGLGVGAASGLVLFLVLMLVWTILGKSVIGAQFPIKLTAVMCAGGLGGIAAKRRAHSRAKLRM